jgi:hypothetical protein
MKAPINYETRVNVFVYQIVCNGVYNGRFSHPQEAFVKVSPPPDLHSHRDVIPTTSGLWATIYRIYPDFLRHDSSAVNNSPIWGIAS